VISTHVLDTARGAPYAGMKVGLYRGDELVSERETNADGRISELSDETLEPGEYRLVFHVEGEFFRQVELTITLADGHYHVPLLVSPYLCTTYRGS
jgi:5-hydroxyisourate hydrolase